MLLNWNCLLCYLLPSRKIKKQLNLITTCWFIHLYLSEVTTLLRAFTSRPRPWQYMYIYWIVEIWITSIRVIVTALHNIPFRNSKSGQLSFPVWKYPRSHKLLVGSLFKGHLKFTIRKILFSALTFLFIYKLSLIQTLVFFGNSLAELLVILISMGVFPKPWQKNMTVVQVCNYMYFAYNVNFCLMHSYQ